MSTWITKEGIEIEPRDMATPHLLSTIHMIERNRMQNLIHVGITQDLPDSVINYYAEWPNAYEELCDEAERRKLIQRGTAQKKLRGRK